MEFINPKRVVLAEHPELNDKASGCRSAATKPLRPSASAIWSSATRNESSRADRVGAPHYRVLSLRSE